jgi:hypothetical protein
MVTGVGGGFNREAMLLITTDIVQKTARKGFF